MLPEVCPYTDSGALMQCVTALVACCYFHARRVILEGRSASLRQSWDTSIIESQRPESANPKYSIEFPWKILGSYMFGIRTACDLLQQHKKRNQQKIYKPFTDWSNPRHQGNLLSWNWQKNNFLSYLKKIQVTVWVIKVQVTVGLT